MFRWYQQSAQCYVYLSDVSCSRDDTNDEPAEGIWKAEYLGSRWFTRVWTLQELLAPKTIKFYSRQSRLLGDRASLEELIYKATQISVRTLRGHSLSGFSVEERFTWTTNRTTKESEDIANCLLSIFGVHMSLIYSEGEANAVDRLRRKIQRRESIRHIPLDVNARPSPRPQQTLARDVLDFQGTTLLTY